MADARTWSELEGWVRDEGFTATAGADGSGGTVDIGAPGAPAEMSVRVEQDRVVLEHAAVLSAGELTDMPSLAGGEGVSPRTVLDRFLDDGPGLLRGTIRPEDGAVVLSTRVFTDGLSRQSFVTALHEMARTRRGLDRLRADLTASRTMLASLNNGIEESRRRMEEAARQEQAEAAAAARAQPQATATTPQPAASPGWAPSHAVPAGGIPAWAGPDPSAAPVANLSPGLELRVDDRLGDWAKVSASNGWVGWVDGRRLATRGPA
jgi:hypothetical protein